MRAFLRVVQAGVFSKAAARLDISPAMVTKHVSSLEERLGVRLLNRTTRQVSLTEAGAAYYEHCARIVADLDDVESAVGALTRAPRGTLRITAGVDIGEEFASLITEFLRAEPEVAPEVVLENRFVDLVEERFDVAIRGAVHHRVEPDRAALARCACCSARRPPISRRTARRARRGPRGTASCRSSTCCCATSRFAAEEKTARAHHAGLRPNSTAYCARRASPARGSADNDDQLGARSWRAADDSVRAGTVDLAWRDVLHRRHRRRRSARSSILAGASRRRRDARSVGADVAARGAAPVSRSQRGKTRPLTSG
jgi:DNA-binding transcriptional LysR family regulator